MEDRLYKLNCTYCGTERDWQLQDSKDINPDIESIDDVLEYDQEVACKKCGCWFRVSEGLKEEDKRLEDIRNEIRAERVSYGELAELVSLKDYIPEGDVELLEWAGVPEK